MSGIDNNKLMEVAGMVDFFIYHVKNDLLELSENTKRLLGVGDEEEIHLSKVKSLIVGVDMVKFLHQFEKWLKGDSSKIIQLQMVDCKNELRTIQIKGYVRYDSNHVVKSIYGAYFDVSFIGN